jgi:ankyrin repeat protein
MQIHIDAKNGNIQGVSEALDKGASIEAADGESKLLLENGADAKYLKWNTLMYAVAFGTLAQVKSCLGEKSALFHRDSCGRTPFLLSVQVGDTRKAELLLSAGANRKDTGQRGKTPFMYAVENDDLEMMTWLAANHFDIDAAGKSIRTTPLMKAVYNGSIKSVRHLLSLGADVNKEDDRRKTAISKTGDPAIMRILLQAGARLEDITNDLRKTIRGCSAPLLSSIPASLYRSQKHRRFGTSNPGIMDIDFWKAMVVSGRAAWYARDLFNDGDGSGDAPVWCFERFGMSITELPDGRIIEIAGEHEDASDPDFCIYNEVVEHRPGKNFTIYGYPEEVFPPTDFHTATLVGDYIYIIGNLGYTKHRRYGETQVFRLNTITFEIEKIETHGDLPGWISRHGAYLEDKNSIRISGGKLCIWEDGNELNVFNKTGYLLDLNTNKWTKTERRAPYRAHRYSHWLSTPPGNGMQIHIDVKNGNIQGVSDALDKGTAIEAIDGDSKWTPLLIALSSQRAGVDMVRFLIDRGANVNLPCGYFPLYPLNLAVQYGNLEKIELLLEKGAEITDDLLIDALHGTGIWSPDLFAVMELLLRKGAPLKGQGKAILDVASRLGRFDIVKLLLKHGANPERLKWNTLMYAVVFGTLSQVKSCLRRESLLHERDSWHRTPFLLSVHAGDTCKAEFLLSAGADRNDTGRCFETPFMYAAENEHLEMMSWLAKNNFDINAAGEFHQTPLMYAAKNGRVNSTKHLLALGADLNKKDNCGVRPIAKAIRSGSLKRRIKRLLTGLEPDENDDDSETAISKTTHPGVMRILLQAGGRIEEINDELRKKLRGNLAPSLSSLSERQYFSQKQRRFGTSNPEKMEIDFWKAMVVSGRRAGLTRYLFNDADKSPVWCFDRLGMSITALPDGRIIEIAGEHENDYDPDFCIYNDVVEHHPGGNFTIYGYPEEIFPPTDFHTATLAGDYIYIIGNLGCGKHRRYGETPVFRLNVITFEIETVETHGDQPGWIFDHAARLVDKDAIRISGGKLCTLEGGKEQYVDNETDYLLDVNTGVFIYASGGQGPF